MAKQTKLKFLFVNEMKMQEAPGVKVKLVKDKYKLGRSSRAKVYSYARLPKVEKLHLVQNNKVCLLYRETNNISN